MIRRATTAALAVALAAAAGPACTPDGTEEEQPSAQEMEALAGNNGPAQASVFPYAPSPRVREAVREAAIDVEEGQATFYADKFEGRRTASGRTFRQAEMVAAHRAFPFGTRLRVTNMRNDREVEVRVVDRGPFGGGSNPDPVLDLSRAAAEKLDFVSQGRAQVRIEVLEWGA